MKFDVVVGNPPYQEEVEGRGEQPPLYNHFYDEVQKITNMATLITPARFLFDAGKTPSKWNTKMLNDTHFKVVEYHEDSKDVFSHVDIKGGVAIGLWNSKKTYGSIGTFIPNETVRCILSKVSDKDEACLSEILYSNTSYRYHTSFYDENPSFSKRVSGGSRRYLSSSVFIKFPEVFFEERPDDSNEYVEIIGRKDYERVKLYFPGKYLESPDNLKNYKVFLASSNGSGDFGERLSNPLIGHPFVGSTETFISFGNFETEAEASNLLKFIKTKTFRLLLGTKKVTQGNKAKKVWGNVPLQNFTSASDIDWSQSIADIDQQLYKKYGLNEEEITFIETHVKEME